MNMYLKRRFIIDRGIIVEKQAIESDNRLWEVERRKKMYQLSDRIETVGDNC